MEVGEQDDHGIIGRGRVAAQERVERGDAILAALLRAGHGGQSERGLGAMEMEMEKMMAMAISGRNGGSGRKEWCQMKQGRPPNKERRRKTCSFHLRERCGILGDGVAGMVI